MALELHQPTYRALRACGHDELAAHLRSGLTRASGGILFARKPTDERKTAARQAVLDLLTPELMPGSISVLSMPGLKWKFEGALAKQREGVLQKDRPQRTTIHAIENDRAIYHAALVRMPGLRNPEHVFKVEPCPRWAERTVSGLWIDRYYFGNVDDLMRTPPQAYDVAWLDYTGPLSVQRLAAIRQFFLGHVRRLLVVTALRARWNRETAAAIDREGDHSEWFWRGIGGQRVHEILYDDGSPMAQFAVEHHA